MQNDQKLYVPTVIEHRLVWDSTYSTHVYVLGIYTSLKAAQDAVNMHEFGEIGHSGFYVHFNWQDCNPNSWATVNLSNGDFWEAMIAETVMMEAA